MEVSGSPFIPLTPIGRQDCEGATSGASITKWSQSTAHGQRYFCRTVRSSPDATDDNCHEERQIYVKFVETQDWRDMEKLFQQGKRRCEIIRLLNVTRQTVSDENCRFKELGNVVEVQEGDENAWLVDAPCCWPGGSFGVCRYKLLAAVDTRRYPQRKTGSGATRKTTRREDRRIVRQALVDPTVTRSTIRSHVDVAIVPQAISRHLAEANLKFKRSFRALPLTPEHRQLHLQWCQARSMWNVTDWQKFVFRDESRFVLGTNVITVYGCGGALVSGTIPSTLFYVILPAQLV
ncbi:HTH_Tnp_Tc3_2 domain-containing protein [Trichonephila clavipes]|uniref:HTH_Tnp_Tc3_2 domain-containing protein n=1 Tax=Trichonephila clavipes TaxID=2585209 RepID=A0A8X6SQH9_TRICX|nr:HTH_Tnp_Tc3_2 domain-containing protein [Trichonephila clavipes]